MNLNSRGVKTYEQLKLSYSKVYFKEMEEVSKNFLEYRSCTEEMTQDNDFSDKGKNHSKRIIETLDDNLEEILHKIYL